MTVVQFVRPAGYFDMEMMHVPKYLNRKVPRYLGRHMAMRPVCDMISPSLNVEISRKPNQGKLAMFTVFETRREGL